MERTVPVCSVNWLCRCCAALSRCLRFLFCVRSFCLPSPVTSSLVSSRRGWSSPLCRVSRVLSSIAVSTLSIAAVIDVKLVLCVFLPWPPYISSAHILKVSVGILSPFCSCPCAGMGLPLGGSSPTANILINLLAMIVSIGPSIAANRFSPADRTAVPFTARLWLFP